MTVRNAVLLIVFCLTSKNSKSLAVRPNARLKSAGFASYTLYYVYCKQIKFSEVLTMVSVDLAHREYGGVPLLAFVTSHRRATRGFAQAGQDIVQSANCKSVLQFRLTGKRQATI